MTWDLVFWIQLTSLIFVSISAPLYIFVIVGLVFYRKEEIHFRNSFFRIWISLGAADLTHAVLFWFSSKIPLMGFFPSLYLRAGKIVACVLMYLTFVTHYCQVFSVGLLSINRLTALLYPSISEHFWRKRWLIPWCVGGIWVVSGAISIPVGLMDVDWLPLPNSTKISFHFLSVNLATRYMFWVGILLAVTTSLIAAAYIVMFCRVQSLTMVQRKALNRHMKLALCAFFVSLFLASLAVCFCLFGFHKKSILFGENAVPFFVACDLNTFCNVYLLLATSEVVRKRMRMLLTRAFCCRKPERIPLKLSLGMDHPSFSDSSVSEASENEERDVLILRPTRSTDVASASCSSDNTPLTTPHD